MEKDVKNQWHPVVLMHSLVQSVSAKAHGGPQLRLPSH